MKREALAVDLIAGLFILLFVYTAVSKFIGFERLVSQLDLYPLIRSNGRILAWVLLLSELAVAALLFFPFTRHLGLCGSYTLMVIFTVAVGFWVYFGKDSLPCVCGGVISKMTWKQHLLFNLVLTILAGWGWRISLRNRKKLLQQKRPADQPVAG